MSKNIIKKGWLYVVTSDTYVADNIYKIGFTEKPGLLESEVRTSLIHQYGTALINPSVIMLIQVAHPKQAESEVFTRLKDYKLQKELYRADFETVIKPQMLWAEHEFKVDDVYEIREEVLQKLLNRLSKKERKIVFDISFASELSFWITSKWNDLSQNNRCHLQQLAQMMPQPSITRSDMQWEKIPQNMNVVSMRKSTFNFVCTAFNNWDRKDPNLHAFLKELIDKC